VIAWLVQAVIVLALVLLFAAGLRAPLGHGRVRVVARTFGVIAALAVALLANIASYRHDVHLDTTQELAFTPAPETIEVLRSLPVDVELIYFYQAQNPAGRAAKQMVEIMGRSAPRLKVRTIDPDQQPALANQLGVRMYNAALLSAQGRRIEVITTEDRDIALGIARLLRDDPRALCFASGHGEYDIDNQAFHTHFEGSHNHSHDAGGIAVVNMEQHGIGRLRRALDKLGYRVRKVNLATGGDTVPADCAALVIANPRTRFAPPDVRVLERYLSAGGNLLLLLEPDFVAGDELSALLRRAGVQLGDGVVVDPIGHYYTDDQMIAIERYAAHPALLGLALSFYPGARPLQSVSADGVRSVVLFASSAQATLAARGGGVLDMQPTARVLAIASEGTLGAQGKPFKLAVVGDADFASNSFYPYLANADVALGLCAWLRGEPRAPALKPPVEVLPLVAMTNAQMQAVFVVCVLLVPGLCGLVGVGVWWRRLH
jgi:ABC-type uncharacterized transport system involved in gliding motility auxiliary subunit